MYEFIFVELFLLCGASVASAQLSIAHSYPLDGNFNYVTLTCLDGALPALGAEFQLNATDIEEEIHDVSDDGNGTISFVLTQEQEGEFTCSRSGTASSGISLAAQPTTENYRSQIYFVRLPSADSEVSIELQCNIQPGALAQRYSVQWRRLFHNENCSDLPLNSELFNVSLNVTSCSDGSQYQCEVSINHDGSLIRAYNGTVITLLIEGNKSSYTGTTSSITISSVALTLAIVLSILLIGTITAIIVGVCLWRKLCSKTKCFKWNKNTTPLPTHMNITSHSSWFGMQNHFYLDSIPELREENEACSHLVDHSRDHVNSSLKNISPESGLFGIQNPCYRDTHVPKPCGQAEACPNPTGHSRDHTRMNSSQSSATSSQKWHFEESDSDTFSDPTAFKANEHMPGLNDYPVVLPDYVSPYSASQISTIGIEVHCNIGIDISYYDKQEQKDLTCKPHRRSRCKHSKRWKKIGHMDLHVHQASHSGDSGIGPSLSGEATPTRVVMSQDVSSLSRCYHPVRRTSSLSTHDTFSTNTFPRSRRHRGSSGMGQRGACDVTHSSNASTLVVPSCIRPTATLHRCTSRGRTYNDELNGFKLKIPRGAIPEGESLTIDIGVALYGPFQYPEGLRPVSPVFWICVRNKKHRMRFLKPVSITIQHCLKVSSEEDVETLGLTFLKGDHEMNSNEKCGLCTVKDKSRFEANTDYGTLYTRHFCYQCIVCKISEFTIQRANFCLFGAIPYTFFYHKPMFVFFFVTFLLKTCLETVRRQIMNMPEIAGHAYHEAKKDFQFSTSPKPAIQIEVPGHLPGGWQLGLQFQNEITFKEVDFLQINQEELKLKEEEGMYPPHFRVFIDGSRTTQKTQAHIQFMGTTKSLVFSIPLSPALQGFKNSTQPVPHHSPVTGATPVTPTIPMTLKNLMNLVAARIPTRWRDFGIQLDIPPQNLDTYPSRDWRECFTCVFTSWRRNTSPDYTWETVIDILESPIINEKKLAEEIRDIITTRRSPSPSPYAESLSRAALSVGSRVKAFHVSTYETYV